MQEFFRGGFNVHHPKRLLKAFSGVLGAEAPAKILSFENYEKLKIVKKFFQNEKISVKRQKIIRKYKF